MKPAPSKYSARNTTNNQNTAICYSKKQEQRQQAIEVAQNTPDEIKNNNIKYLLKR